MTTGSGETSPTVAEAAAGFPGAGLGSEVPVRRRGLLVLLGCLTGLTPLAVDMYLPALPSLTRDLQTTNSAAQLTLAALLLGLASGQLLAGPLSDRLGRRPPVLAGLGLFALASLGCAFAPSIGALIGLRFVQGFTGAAAVVVARAVVRDLYAGVGAARAFASLMLVMGAAPVLAPVIGAQVLRMTSWRGIFVVLSFAGLVLLVVCWRALPETLAEEHRHDGGMRSTLGVFAMLLRDRRFLLPTLAGGAGFAAMFAYIAGSPYVLQEIYGLSPQEYSLVFGSNAVLLIALSQVSGRVVHRTGPARLLLAGACLSTTGAVLLVLTAELDLGFPLVLLGLLLVVGAVGFTAPNATALALAHHGRRAGAASALLGLLQFVFGAIAAALSGLGGQRADLSMALTMLGASLLALGCAVRTQVGVRRGG
ncbi:MAG: Bcr/CflA family multidrug efflux MFS transporter [Mycobacteriales bacterium]